MKMELSAPDLARAMSNVAGFTSTDDTIEALAHVSFEADGEVLTLAATDRYRLGSDTTRLIEPGEDKLQWLLHRADVTRIAKALKASKYPTTTVEVTGQIATFAVGGDTLSAILSPATFPRWRDLIPTGEPGSLSEITFEPKRLESFARVVPDLEKRSRNYSIPMKITMNARPYGPALIHIGPTFVGMLMPMKDPAPR